MKPKGNRLRNLKKREIESPVLLSVSSLKLAQVENSSSVKLTTLNHYFPYLFKSIDSPISILQKHEIIRRVKMVLRQFC